MMQPGQNGRAGIYADDRTIDRELWQAEHNALKPAATAPTRPKPGATAFR